MLALRSYCYRYELKCFHINIDTNTNIIINPSTLTSANTSNKINRRIITNSSAEIHIYFKPVPMLFVVLVFLLIPILILIPIRIFMLTLILKKF